MSPDDFDTTEPNNDLESALDILNVVDDSDDSDDSDPDWDLDGTESGKSSDNVVRSLITSANRCGGQKACTQDL